MVSAGVTFILYDSKTAEPIWTIADTRHVTNDRLFDNTKPEDMTKRIFRRSMSKLSTITR